MSSLRLFGDFGPPAFRSYVDPPPKARWWPIIAAFVTGAVFVLAVRGLPQHRPEGAPTNHIYALHDRSSPEYAGAVTTPTITRAEPTKFLEVQEEGPPIQEDQPTISPTLEILAKPTDIARSPVETRHSRRRRILRPQSATLPESHVVMNEMTRTRVTTTQGATMGGTVATGGNQND